MRNFLLLTGLLASGLLSAQLSLTTAYNFNSFVPDRGTEQSGLTDNGPELQLGYWFRLPTKRVEFLPTVYATGEFSDQPSYREYGALFKTNVYPFDFGGDCDCPTFGKQGPKLEKGFFVQLAPGYARSERNPLPGEFPLTIEDRATFFVFSGGIGLDIGVTNFLTVTPLASARYQATQQGGVFPLEGFSPDRFRLESGRRWTYQLGLQLLARFDHKRY